MDAKECLAKLQELDDEFDTERAHTEADECLSNFVRSLGYTEIADVFDKLDKWYG